MAGNHTVVSELPSYTWHTSRPGKARHMALGMRLFADCEMSEHLIIGFHELHELVRAAAASYKCSIPFAIRLNSTFPLVLPKA